MKIDFKEALSFQEKRIFNVLAKRLLILLEDLQNEHQNHFDKLFVSIPTSYRDVIEQANYFDKNRFAHYRKRVLDFCNDGYREILDELGKYDISLSKSTIEVNSVEKNS